MNLFILMLEIEEIHKSYFQHKVLRDISFSVKAGKIVGLLGPNGAGKTTLIRIINQIIAPDRGFISFNNKLLNLDHLKSIGYLPEERGLYKRMTIESQAYFFGQLRGMDKRAIRFQLNKWLDQFNIQDWRKKRIEELSKGMAQKIQFIFSVLHEPDLLILDEPFSGFDPVNADLIRKELITMKEKGVTILLSTHNMKSVEELCDEVILIDKGEKVLEGSLELIKNQHKKGIYAITFTGNMIAFATALWSGYEIVSKEIIDDNTFRVLLKMRGENELNDLLATLIPNMKIISAYEVLPSMEEIFIELTNIQKEPLNE